MLQYCKKFHRRSFPGIPSQTLEMLLFAEITFPSDAAILAYVVLLVVAFRLSVLHIES